MSGITIRQFLQSITRETVQVACGQVYNATSDESKGQTMRNIYTLFFYLSLQTYHLSLQSFPCHRFPPLSTLKAQSSCWVCRLKLTLQHVIALMYMLHLLLQEGKISRVETWQHGGFSLCCLWQIFTLRRMIRHGTGKHDHTAVLLAAWDFNRNQCEGNRTCKINKINFFEKGFFWKPCFVLFLGLCFLQ